MKIRYLFIFLIITFLLFPFFSLSAQDQCPNGGTCMVMSTCHAKEGFGCSGSCTGCDSIGSDCCCCVKKEAGEDQGFSMSQLFAKLGSETGLGNVGEFTSVIGKVGQAALGFVGVVIVGLIIYGGITWMTASGNEEKVTKGKKVVIGSLVGMVIIVMSYGAASLIYSQVGGTASLPGGDGGGTNDCPTASSTHHSSVACYENQADCEDSHIGTCACNSSYGTCANDQVCCYFGWGDQGGGACLGYCAAADNCNPHTENDVGRKDCGPLQTCCVLKQ